MGDERVPSADRVEHRPSAGVSEGMGATSPVYLDNHATTPCDPRVVSAMLPWLRSPSNSGSEHAFGRAALAAVDEAREKVARLAGATPDEVVFTSGATESNNLAIRGTAAARTGHVVVGAAEHESVRSAARIAGRKGGSVVIPVDRYGSIDGGAARIGEFARRDSVVSVLAANNEVGSLADVAALAVACHRVGAIFHTDAAQAIGKVPFAFDEWGVDVASISGHKVYGPPGVGAVVVSRRTKLRPILFGGGQERGLRPGTVPTFLAVGLGAACEIASGEMADEAVRVLALRERLREAISAAWPGARVNGHPTRRLPGNLNILLPGVDASAILECLPGLAASTGAACAGKSGKASRVLSAMGLAKDESSASFRFGVGRFTTGGEVEEAIRLLTAVLAAVARSNR